MSTAPEKFKSTGFKGQKYCRVSISPGKMAYVLPRLSTKKDVDTAIKSTVDKVLVLRFGREADAVCLQLDEIVSGRESDGTSIPSHYLCVWLCVRCVMLSRKVLKGTFFLSWPRTR